MAAMNISVELPLEEEPGTVKENFIQLLIASKTSI
jgi:hypothetical protein